MVPAGLFSVLDEMHHVVGLIQNNRSDSLPHTSLLCLIFCQDEGLFVFALVWTSFSDPVFILPLHSVVDVS
jgi:hypothetical protein